MQIIKLLFKENNQKNNDYIMRKLMSLISLETLPKDIIKQDFVFVLLR